MKWVKRRATNCAILIVVFGSRLFPFVDVLAVITGVVFTQFVTVALAITHEIIAPLALLLTRRVRLRKVVIRPVVIPIHRPLPICRVRLTASYAYMRQLSAP